MGQKAPHRTLASGEANDCSTGDKVIGLHCITDGGAEALGFRHRSGVPGQCGDGRRLERGYEDV